MNTRRRAAGQALPWFQLLSHKVLRWMTPLFLLIALIASLRLAAEPLYRLILAAQTVFYLLAVFEAVAQRSRLIHAVPFYFCMVNIAAGAGLWSGLWGRQDERWKMQARREIEIGRSLTPPADAVFAAKPDRKR